MFEYEVVAIGVDGSIELVGSYATHITAHNESVRANLMADTDSGTWVYEVWNRHIPVPAYAAGYEQLGLAL